MHRILLISAVALLGCAHPHKAEAGRDAETKASMRLAFEIQCVDALYSTSDTAVVEKGLLRFLGELERYKASGSNLLFPHAMADFDIALAHTRIALLHRSDADQGVYERHKKVALEAIERSPESKLYGEWERLITMVTYLDEHARQRAATHPTETPAWCKTDPDA
jgi:hypothetical protein